MSKGRSIIPIERKEDQCLNCKKELHGEHFCPDCGQENTDRNISFWTLTTDFLGDYFSFDSKLFRTMIPLLFFPGKVPQEFMDGKRVRYIPPLRLLIFSSFIFFFIWGITFEPDNTRPSEIAKKMDEQLEEGFEQQVMTGDSTIALGVDGASLSLTGLDSVEESSTLLKVNELRRLIDHGVHVDQAVDSISSDNSPFEKRLYLQIGKMYDSDTATISKYFVSNLSVIILVMQPFFALLLWLLYIRRRKQFRFIQHLVFTLYYHGWILVISTIGLLIQQVYHDMKLEIFISFLGLIYMPLALKRFYGQGWIKTLFKSGILLLFYIGLIIPFFLILSFLMSFYFF